MKLLVVKVLAVVALSSWMAGCSNASGEDIGMVAGAGAGAIAGYVISPNSGVGPAIGAGAGALIGREVGRHHDYHHSERKDGRGYDRRREY